NLRCKSSNPNSVSDGYFRQANLVGQGSTHANFILFNPLPAFIECSYSYSFVPMSAGRVERTKFEKGVNCPI
ncbi:MAG: hypothetical protein KBT59_07620, partial [Sphingomonadales bacterium]|nr:hypothetical protein [Sphingomonadales bacterium]